MVKSIGAGQLSKNAGDNGLHAQGDHQEVGNRGSQEEAMQAVGLPQAGVIEMEAPAFPIREQGFGGEPQGIEAFGFGVSNGSKST